MHKSKIAIETCSISSDKLISQVSHLFHEKLSEIIKGQVHKLTLNRKADLFLGCITLDLGDIKSNVFETQLADKLAIALEKELSAYYDAKPTFSSDKVSLQPGGLFGSHNVKNRTSVQSEQQSLADPFPGPVRGQALIAAVDHYLQQGDWPAALNPRSPMDTGNSRSMTQDLWHHIHRQPPQWLPMLAKHCLKPLGQRRLALILPPAVQQALCRLLAEGSPEKITMVAQLNHESTVIPAQFATAAEQYFSNQSVVAKDNPEVISTQPKWLPQKTLSAILGLTHGVEIDISDPGLVTTLKGNKPPTWSGAKPVAQPMGVDMTPRSGECLAVSNAGCLIFWPLLSTFFSVFGLLEKQVFIHQQAQIEAVCLLDWLIWGDDEISDGRLSLNKVICGLPIHFDTVWHTPAAEQKVLISEWLEKIRQQLPVWKRMGAKDIRTLFLQRPGEIIWLDGAVAIGVNPEAYDALINTWPWPMNMACFNWLQQPLSIQWL
ncbi:contractile injection system tape measure protein [Yersinia pseudotuberculosis]|uniref:contractile injection system tape measure protein n=1 Tax=Yersinia pseudotuberculosis TaxID=633 RepID=UPI00067AD0F3|nr:contractile injection system tape measure protein [Yersinia pseudotuberculosis]